MAKALKSPSRVYWLRIALFILNKDKYFLDELQGISRSKALIGSRSVETGRGHSIKSFIIDFLRGCKPNIRHLRRELGAGFGHGEPLHFYGKRFLYKFIRLRFVQMVAQVLLKDLTGSQWRNGFAAIRGPETFSNGRV